MLNHSTATLVAHDEAQGTSWIAWNGLRLSVPFARSVAVGSQVRWAVDSHQIRLPARSARPQRRHETPFRARLLQVRPRGAEVEMLVAPPERPDQPLVLSVAAEVVERKNIRVGDELLLRLRGDAIELTPSGTDGARLGLGFAAGAVVGTLGGLIGLGGAEFRLPVLIALFGFSALAAVILNKAMSLVVVASALLFRSSVVPLDQVLAHGPVIVNLLAGSLLGAWIGAGWAVRIPARTLQRVIAVLLLLIAGALLLGHDAASAGPVLDGWALWLAGAAAGFGIGTVASLLGVAGGELLIPTLVLLFGADIKLAGSLSLVVSLPTMVVGIARYSRDASFAVLLHNRCFVLAMAAGSIVGAGIGGLLLPVVPGAALLPLLAGVLVLSAAKVWRHR